MAVAVYGRAEQYTDGLKRQALGDLRSESHNGFHMKKRARYETKENAPSLSEG